MNFDEVYRLSRAKELLDQGDQDSLLYCCLELRLCIELICYRRLGYYAEYLPRSAKKLWRAKDVLDALLELDPAADKDYTLAMALEKPDGKRGQPVHVGTYRAITRQFLLDYYDQLSSFLHAPTIAEVQAGGQRDTERLRALVAKTIGVLEGIAGNIFQSTFGLSVEFPCDTCGTRIRRRTEWMKDQEIVRCLEKSCQAEYELTFPAQGQFLRKMVQLKFECPSCGRFSYFGRHIAARNGVQLRCLHCSEIFGVQKTLVLVPLKAVDGAGGHGDSTEGNEGGTSPPATQLPSSSGDD